MQEVVEQLSEKRPIDAVGLLYPPNHGLQATHNSGASLAVVGA